MTDRDCWKMRNSAYAAKRIARRRTTVRTLNSTKRSGMRADSVRAGGLLRVRPAGRGPKDTTLPGRRTAFRELENGRGLAGYGGALVPRAAASALRGDRAAAVRPGRRRARAPSVPPGRDRPRGVTAPPAGGAGGTKAAARDADRSCGGAGGGVGHDAADRRLAPRQQRTGARPPAGGPAEPDLRARGAASG